MAWIDYDNATPEQQAGFRKTNSHLKQLPLSSYQVWITRDGRASRRKGHWQWTEKFGKEVLENSRRILGDARSKGDLADFKPGTTFHTTR